MGLEAQKRGQYLNEKTLPIPHFSFHFLSLTHSLPTPLCSFSQFSLETHTHIHIFIRMYECSSRNDEYQTPNPETEQTSPEKVKVGDRRRWQETQKENNKREIWSRSESYLRKGKQILLPSPLLPSLFVVTVTVYVCVMVRLDISGFCSCGVRLCVVSVQILYFPSWPKYIEFRNCLRKMKSIRIQTMLWFCLYYP